MNSFSQTPPAPPMPPDTNLNITNSKYSLTENEDHTSFLFSCTFKDKFHHKISAIIKNEFPLSILNELNNEFNVVEKNIRIKIVLNTNFIDILLETKNESDYLKKVQTIKNKILNIK